MRYSVGSSGFSGDWNSSGYGSARWMRPEEADELGLYAYHPQNSGDPQASIVLGQASDGRLCFLNRQGHLLVLAPPRSGKGVGFVQSNLVAYAGSMVVTDAKGENAAVSYKYRREALGHNVVVLDPTEKLASYPGGASIPTHGFNPLLAFDDADYAKVVDDIALVADALLVAKEGEKEQHWRDGARSFLTGVLTYLVFFVPHEERDLITLARLASGLEAPLEDLFASLTHNDHPDPEVRDVIARTGAWYGNVNPKERASFVSVALRSLTWMNSPVWHRQLRRSDFHPYDLKAGKTTLFVVCPFDKLEQYAPWFRLVLSCCIVAILRAPKRSPYATLFMLDEYASSVGRLAMLEQSIPYIEGAGGRYAMVFQYLSQMNTLWPDPEYHGIFASASAHIFFNVSDQYTSEYVSRYMGKYGAMTPSGGTVGFVQRDLLTPDEVRSHPPDDQIVFVRGYRPAWLGKINVLRQPWFKAQLLPNPTYEIHESPHPSVEAPRRGALLSASAALQRAKAPDRMSLDGVVEAIDRKFPDKQLRFDGDFYGYDEVCDNPETGLRESVFTPVVHISLLESISGF